MAKIANSVIRTKPADTPVESHVEKKNFRIPVGFALLLAFVAISTVLSLPVMAATPDINLTWVGTMFSSLITAANTCAAPTQLFIETWFPVVVEFVIYGVVLGILGLIGYAFRGVILAGVKMLEGILKV